MEPAAGFCEDAKDLDFYNFEPLPTLPEDEENVSLADVLSLRDRGLSEQEAWAVCLECSLSMRSVVHAALFQTLCITPDTLAFNTSGNVCFMEQLSDDPEGAFVPPEFDLTGNTFEAHIYSLGATLRAALEFVSEPQLELRLSPDLETLLGQMQAEDPRDRPDLQSIITLCEEKVQPASSCRLCRSLSATGRRVLSIESFGAFQDINENAWRGRPAPRSTGPKRPSGDFSTDPEALSTTESLPQPSASGDKEGEVGQGSRPSPMKTLLSVPMKNGEGLGREELASLVLDARCPLGELDRDTLKRSPLRKVQTFPRLLTDGPEASTLCLSLASSKKQLTIAEVFPPDPRKGFLEGKNGLSSFKTQPKSRLWLEQEPKLQLEWASRPGCHINEDSGASRELEVSSPGQRPVEIDKALLCPVDHGDAGPDTPASGGEEGTPEETSPTSAAAPEQSLSLKGLLSKLGRPLRECELWALCLSCLRTLQRHGGHPACLCLDNVLVAADGAVLFGPPPAHSTQDSFFLAPEVAEGNPVTEKASVYCVAAVLWTAAKFSVPHNHKLALTRRLKSLLLDMARRCAQERPSAAEAIEVCGNYLLQRGMDSKKILAHLRASTCKVHPEEQAIALQSTFSVIELKPCTAPESETGRSPAVSPPTHPPLLPYHSALPESRAEWTPPPPARAAGRSEEAATPQTGQQGAVRKQPPRQGSRRSEEAAAPIQGSRHSEEAAAPIQGSGRSEEATAPIQGSRHSEEATAPIQGSGRSEEAAAPIQGSGHSEEAATPSGQQAQRSEEAAAPIQGSRRSEEAAAPIQGSRHSEEAAAPIQGSRCSEEATPPSRAAGAVRKQPSSSRAAGAGHGEEAAVPIQGSRRSEEAAAPIQGSGHSEEAAALIQGSRRSEEAAAPIQGSRHSEEAAAPIQGSRHSEEAADPIQCSRRWGSRRSEEAAALIQGSRRRGSEEAAAPIQGSGHRQQALGTVRKQPSPSRAAGAVRKQPAPSRAAGAGHGEEAAVPIQGSRRSEEAAVLIQGSRRSEEAAALIQGSGRSEEAAALIQCSRRSKEAAALIQGSRCSEEAAALIQCSRRSKEAAAPIQGSRRSEEAAAPIQGSGRSEEAAALIQCSRRSKEAAALTQGSRCSEEAAALIQGSRCSFRPMDSGSRRHAGPGSAPCREGACEGPVASTCAPTLFKPSVLAQDTGVARDQLTSPMGTAEMPEERSSPLDRESTGTQAAQGLPGATRPDQPAPDTEPEGAAVDSAGASVPRGSVPECSCPPGPVLTSQQGVTSGTAPSPTPALPQQAPALPPEHKPEGQAPSRTSPPAGAPASRGPHPTRKPPRSKAAEPEAALPGVQGPFLATGGPNSPRRPESHPDRPRPPDRKLCPSSVDTPSPPTATACPSLQEAMRLIQEEFAFDGYLDNGLEALIMGEYIYALKDLTFATFCGAISEKFCDLYWNEQLLQNLFKVVNRPASPPESAPDSQRPHPQHSPRSCSIYSKRPSPPGLGDEKPTAARDSGDPCSPTALSSRDPAVLLQGNFEVGFRPQKSIKAAEKHQPEAEADRQQGPGPEPAGRASEPDSGARLSKPEEGGRTVSPGSAEFQSCSPGWSSAFYEADCFGADVYNYVKDLGRQKTNGHLGPEAQSPELEQQLMIEKRNYRKTLKFYQKLLQKEKRGKGSEVRTMLCKLRGQLEEMKSKVQFLGLVKKYLQVTYAERWGVEPCALPVIVNIAAAPCDTLDFSPLDESSSLIFYNVNRPPCGGGQKARVLQAGTPLGLMAYLYSSGAFLEGYVQQFLYTFRYFCTPHDFLHFLLDRISSTLSRAHQDPTSTFAKIYRRSLCVLQAWVEDCYTVDFTRNAGLLGRLEDFISSKILPLDGSAEHLLDLLEVGTDQRAACASPDTDLEDPKQAEDPRPFNSLCKRLSEDGASWKSFSWKLPRGNGLALPHKERQYTIASALPKPCFFEDFYGPYAKASEKGPYFLTGHSTHQLFTQLTLLQQELFQKCHPVHFLNSRALGVTDKSAALPRANSSESLSTKTCSLFLPNYVQDKYLVQLLRHGDDVSTWVAAEIVISPTSKLQVNLLSKFLLIAKCCYEQRNFATAMQILGGLEHPSARQCPAWRILPAKIAEVMEELKAVEVFLKSDSLCLMEGRRFRAQPTLPSARLLAMHIQQLETGGFTMTNGAHRWSKLRNIAKVASQVHAFQETPYTFSPDPKLQAHLKQRIARFSGADVSILAADSRANSHQTPSERHPRKIQDKLRRMKATFQ
ncbi:kinase non-catalytic C-lobe domain-containing protein 1 [Dipodomys spectabilis]|uniref:kinase non-catalytic C-lobe domain-containing protein 1 n=1 Tax=Dipodomys spectabilis TaxID=105255 RepID=UPI001C5391E4|nr:kinase non-catalytic C-lobe domain-containing protein 1 [Dipodomys spectabilis]